MSDINYMSNSQVFDKFKDLFPFSGNDIYLEDKSKQVKAVCSNAEISEFISRILNDWMSKSRNDPDYNLLAKNNKNISSLDTDETNVKKQERVKLYQNLIQDAYYLHIAISKAHIIKNSLETIFLEKAYHNFYKSLFELIEKENIKIEKNDSNTLTNI